MLNRKDKRGVWGIFVFFIVMFSILIVGFVAAISLGVIDFASDTITPILTDLGEVEDMNMSNAMRVTVGVVDGFVQAMPWLLTLGFAMSLVFSIVFVTMYKTNPHPAFIGLYIALMFLLIFGAIIMSNAYEDIYNRTDELAVRLQENVAMSYMIIYSPAIFVLIAFITGIYMFSSPKEEGGIEI